MNDLTRVFAALARMSMLPFTFAACSGAAGSASSAQDAGATSSGRDSGGSLHTPVTGGSNSNNGNPGDGSSGSGNTTSGIDDGGSGEVALVVGSATVETGVGGFPPPSGDFFLVVSVTLKNLGASEPLTMSPLAFTLRTSQGLIVSPSPVQATAECSASLSVASGGEDSCSVVFEVPEGRTPTALAYADGSETATAPVPATEGPSLTCGTYAGWVSGGASQACLACLEGAARAADAGNGACAGAAKAYTTSCSACANECSPLNGSSDPLCTCELGCDDSACQALFQSLMSCMTSTCEGACQ